MDLKITNPNFSIVVPTGCNAKCSFCFWEKAKDIPEKMEYLKKLQKTLQGLPPEFVQCSITGGEPTTCSFLREILLLVRMKFEKVVLSTNGFKVEPWVFEYIDHLNISRHHWEEGENQKIFNSASVASSKEISQICQLANEEGVDVTLNTVVPADFNDEGFLRKMISFSRECGANALAIRKQHGDLKDLPLESTLKSKVATEFGCGVCKTKTRYIDGFPVLWKYSVKEPSKDSKGVYELIFHQNAILSPNWKDEKNSSGINLDSPKIFTEPKKTPKKVAPKNGCSFPSRGC